MDNLTVYNQDRGHIIPMGVGGPLAGLKHAVKFRRPGVGWPAVIEQCGFFVLNQFIDGVPVNGNAGFVKS